MYVYQAKKESFRHGNCCLLVSQGGYPLAYCIHEGNKYEGHTMLPAVTEFVRKYKLEDFIVVADSGLMNGDNIAELTRVRDKKTIQKVGNLANILYLYK